MCESNPSVRKQNSIELLTKQSDMSSQRAPDAVKLFLLSDLMSKLALSPKQEFLIRERNSVLGHRAVLGLLLSFAEESTRFLFKKAWSALENMIEECPLSQDKKRLNQNHE